MSWSEFEPLKASGESIGALTKSYLC